MKCPHCRKELEYPDYAYNNAVTYQKSCTVATECCGKFIYIKPVTNIVVEKLKNKPGDTDDWGTEYK